MIDFASLISELGIVHLPLFIAAGLLLNLTPGPDVLYIMSSALRSGARAGMVASLGITTGCFVHVAAAALGIGALLAASSAAFTLLKWAGAAYLVWTGMKLLLSKASVPAQEQAPAMQASGRAPLSMRAVYLGGFWTNVLNPKVAIFFLAFLPQFITPDAPHKTGAFLLLGGFFILGSIPLDMGWGLVAAWLARHPTVQQGMHWLDRLAGAMFIAFGLRLALSEQPLS